MPALLAANLGTGQLGEGLRAVHDIVECIEDAKTESNRAAGAGGA